MVAKLIDMKDTKYATALEITAGGKVSCELHTHTHTHTHAHAHTHTHTHTHTNNQ